MIDEHIDKHLWEKEHKPCYDALIREYEGVCELIYETAVDYHFMDIVEYDDDSIDQHVIECNELYLDLFNVDEIVMLLSDLKQNE